MRKPEIPHQGKPLKPYVYRDFGSLVSLGEYSTSAAHGQAHGREIFSEAVRPPDVHFPLSHACTVAWRRKVGFDLLGRLFRIARNRG